VIDISGSGDASVDGDADDAQFTVTGSGDIAADRLVARKVAVSISGSGDARVNATEALDARVSGSGDVAYRGQSARCLARCVGVGVGRG
jgi:hypothetical protein